MEVRHRLQIIMLKRRRRSGLPYEILAISEVKICDGGLRIRGGWRSIVSECGTRVPRLGARSAQTKFTNIARLSKFSQISESTVNFVSFLDCEIISEGVGKS